MFYRADTLESTRDQITHVLPTILAVFAILIVFFLLFLFGAFRRREIINMLRKQRGKETAVVSTLMI